MSQSRRPSRASGSRIPPLALAKLDSRKLDQLSNAETELQKLALWDKVVASLPLFNGPAAALCHSAEPQPPVQIQFAMRIFFPPKENGSARSEAKKRLRMILVADRCTLPVSSLTTMKTEIVKAVSQFVEVEGEETVDVNLTRDDALGTVREKTTLATAPYLCVLRQ